LTALYFAQACGTTYSILIDEHAKIVSHTPCSHMINILGSQRKETLCIKLNGSASWCLLMESIVPVIEGVC